MSSKTYSTLEAGELLNVSDRTINRYLNTFFKKTKEGYILSQKMIDILQEEYSNKIESQPKTDEDNQRQPELSEDNQDYEESEEDYKIEKFTHEEYDEFHRRLSEYPFLKDRINDVLADLDYHRKSANSHNRQMEKILDSLKGRNYIEAKDIYIEDH